LSAKTVSTIRVQTFSGSTLLDSGLASITYIPKVLPVSWAKLSTADPTVGAYADLTFQLTVTTPVPYNGFIILVLPKWDRLFT